MDNNVEISYGGTLDLENGINYRRSLGRFSS